VSDEFVCGDLNPASRSAERSEATVLLRFKSTSRYFLTTQTEERSDETASSHVV